MKNKSLLLNLKDKINSKETVRNVFKKVPHILHRLDPIVPMTATLQLAYYMRMGKKLNLENPKDFNEKLQWLKVYYRDPLYVQCADKYRVREYVADKGFKEILNDLYQVYESADDISFAELPDRFVMKTNHASATNIICDDKSQLDEVEVKKQFRSWLKRKNGYIAGEYHYNYIRPLILVEKNLSSGDGILPIDYKIFCFNGKPRYIAIFAGRSAVTFSSNKRAVFDFNWVFKDYVTQAYYIEPRKFKRPAMLNQMYNIAERLSASFPFVRVDLYEVEGRLIFGELTFFPAGGFLKTYYQSCLDELGGLLALPPRSKTRRWI